MPVSICEPAVRQGADEDNSPRLQTPFGPVSLRDFFAGQALTGVIRIAKTNADIGGPLPHSHVDGVAVMAYEVADAMLAAREKGPNDGSNG